MTFIKFEGYCPNCGNKTLYLNDDSKIHCHWGSCTVNDAAHRILQDSETQHIVDFKSGIFTIRHPLRERLDDDLYLCTIHQYLSRLDGPPVDLGRYRVTWHRNRGSEDILNYELLGEQ